MKTSAAFVGAILALCGLPFFNDDANAQSPDAKPVYHTPKVTVPQLRPPQRVEKAKPKIQDRAEALTSQVAAAGTEKPATASPQASAPTGETQNFQGWTVTCLPQPADNSPRTCVAKMGVLKSNEDRRPILIVSVVKTGGSATFVLQTPTGIELKTGASVQIGKAAARRLVYDSCEPALCTASVQMDDPFVQELASAPSAVASWVGIGIGEVRVEFALQEVRNTLAYLVSR